MLGRIVKSLSNSSKALASTNSRCAVVKVQCRGFEKRKRRNVTLQRYQILFAAVTVPTVQNHELDKEGKRHTDEIKAIRYTEAKKGKNDELNLILTEADQVNGAQSVAQRIKDTVYPPTCSPTAAGRAAIVVFVTQKIQPNVALCKHNSAVHGTQQGPGQWAYVQHGTNTASIWLSMLRNSHVQ